MNTKSVGHDSDDTEGPAPSDSYVQSLARGLQVLRSFGKEAPTQTLSGVAERTALTRAGARRLLLTLQTLGYVEQDGRTFRLTPQVMELGFGYMASQPWWHLAQPLMEELTQTLGESTSTAVLDGEQIVYVLRVPVQRIMAMNLGIGSRLPAFNTSMGRVLLASLPEDDRVQRVQAMQIVAATPRTITDKDKLLSVLSQVRRQGWALVNEELELGLMSVAVPIHDRAGKVVAAINVSSRPGKQSPTQLRERCLPALLSVAHRISAMLP